MTDCLVSGMYKNQLQELAQRSCFNLPSYACVREGPDHAPRFKASVNFNGETFHGPSQCTTLRQAEHAAAEVALTNLSSRALSRTLAARVLDETGVYKNLLQETTHRAGLKLPIYTTVRSGPGHQPVFTSTVELAGMCIAGELAKTKKQAEKNAAMAAWSALKQMPGLEALPRPKDESEGGGGIGGGDEQEQLVRYLSNFKSTENMKHSMQRDHYQHQQQKQRIGVAGFNVGTSFSASPRRSSRFHHQWRLLEPLTDFSIAHPSQQQQKKSSFLPPPLSTRSEVRSSLLFTLNSVSSHEPFSSKEKFNNSHFQSTSRSIPFPFGDSSPQARSQEIQNLLEVQNLERVNEKASVQAKPSCSVLSHRFTDSKSSLLAARAFSPPRALKFPIEATQPTCSSSIFVPRTLSTGGFHRRGIAPPVQIRSVIPVCAAPPMPQSQPAGGGHSIIISNKESGVEISSVTSKLNKLQL